MYKRQALTKTVDQKIYAVTSAISELVHGFEFARLLSLYYHAYIEDDEETKAKVVRWFRGEYALKREAKEALGVNIIITDDDWYDYLKIFAVFFRLAGYTGMMLMIDELVNIYKIPNTITRQYNYEKLLTMYNDTLQGKARYLGIIMGATPQAVEDKRRGLYSYCLLYTSHPEAGFSAWHTAREPVKPVAVARRTAPDSRLLKDSRFASSGYFLQQAVFLLCYKKVGCHNVLDIRREQFLSPMRESLFVLVFAVADSRFRFFSVRRRLKWFRG